MTRRRTAGLALLACSLPLALACGSSDREVFGESTAGTGASGDSGGSASGGSAEAGSGGEGQDSGGEAGTSASTTASTGATGATSASDSGDGSGSATGAETSASTGDVRLDVGSATSITSGGEAGGMGCDKVDFLFVIDNSGSMTDEQSRLISSFPGFISAIGSTVSGQDFHLMVLTTDPKLARKDGGGSQKTCSGTNCFCTPVDTCCEPSGPVCAPGSSAESCNGFPCAIADTAEPPCDFEFAAGQRANVKQGVACLPQGQHYYSGSATNVTEFSETFTCLADVGAYGGGDEMPMEAIVTSIDAAHVGAGGCNEGFLRDDAILVITFITDEEDDYGFAFPNGETGSKGEPADWYNAVVAAKHGDPNAVVVLGIYGDSGPGAICPPGSMPAVNGSGAEPGPRLQSFVSMFPNGRSGSVCAADLSPFFAEAVSVIDTTCDTFIPPG